MIHNGCTTGIEAYLCDNPAIAYTPAVSERFGDALPNKLSICCVTDNEVIEAIKNKQAQTKNPSSVLCDYITHSEDRLCCDNIINIISTLDHTPAPKLLTYTQGLIIANKRRIIKRVKGINKNSKYNQSFQELRFPTLEFI